MHISNSEWRVLNTLWNEPKTLMDITAELDQKTGWTRHTIISLLKRLEEKDCVGFEQRGRTKYFYATVDKNNIVCEATNDFVETVYDGNFSLLASNMVKSKSITKDEVRKLKKLISEYEKGIIK